MNKLNFIIQTLFFVAALLSVMLDNPSGTDRLSFGIIQLICGIYEYTLCVVLIIKDGPARKYLMVHWVLSTSLLVFLVQDHSIDFIDYVSLGIKQSLLPWLLAFYLWCIFFWQVIYKSSRKN